MAALQWRVESEWACQERRPDNGRSVMESIRVVKGWWAVTDADIARAGEHVLLTVDEMVEVEIHFRTGLAPKKEVRG